MKYRVCKFLIAVPAIIILSLIFIPNPVHSDGKLSIDCSDDNKTCSDNASCQNSSLCICDSGFFPDDDNNVCNETESMNVSVSNINETAFDLEWDAVFPAVQEIKYIINITSGDSNYSRTNDTNSTDISISELNPGALYEVSIVAIFNGSDDSYPVSKMTSITVLTLPLLPSVSVITPTDNTSAVAIKWNSTAETTNYVYLVATSANKSFESLVSDEQLIADGYDPGSSIEFTVVTEARKNEKKARSRNSSKVRGYTYPVKAHKIDFLDVTHDSFSVNVTPTTPGHVSEYEFVFIETSTNTTLKNLTEVSNISYSGLSPFTNYIVKVWVIAYGLKSKEPVSKNVQTKEYTPFPPTGVSVTATGEAGGLNVTWTPGSPANGKLTDYEIEWNDSHKNVSADVTYFNLTSEQAPPGSRHCFKIRVYNSYGSSNWTKTSCLLLSDGQASPPQNLKKGESFPTNVSIAWEPPKTDNGKIFEYFIVLRKRDGITGDLVGSCLKILVLKCNSCAPLDRDNLTANGNNSLNDQISVCGNLAEKVENHTFGKNFSITIDDLKPSSLYLIIVFGVNRAGPSENASVDVHTAQQLSDKPASFDVESVGSRWLNLKWSPPSTPNGVILSYLLLRQMESQKMCLTCTCTDCSTRKDYLSLTDDGSSRLTSLKNTCTSTVTTIDCSFRYNSTELQVNLTGLKPYKQYSSTVWPVNSLGPGSEMSVSRRTKADVPTSASGVTLERTAEKTLFSKWSPPSEENGPSIHYYLKLKSSVEGTTITKNTTASEFTFPNLKACTDYEITVLAANSAGNSTDATQPVRANTKVAKPPKPVVIQLTNLSSTAMELTWSEVTVDKCPISYNAELARYPDLKFNKKLQAVTTKAKFTGLSPDAQYVGRVKAIAGNKDKYDKSESEFSDNSQATSTSEDAPGPVGHLQCLQPEKKYNEIFCSWTVPDVPNGQIRYYEIQYGIGTAVNTKETAIILKKDVKPQVRYVVTVRAITVKKGMPKTISITLKPGPPKVGRSRNEVNAIMVKNIRNVEDPTKQLRIDVPCDAFSEDYGAVNRVSLVVRASNSQGALSSNDATQPGTWGETNAGQLGPYQALVVDCSNSAVSSRRRRRRAVDRLRSLVVGREECAPGQNDCNGPLTPDMLYVVSIRGYTDGGAATAGKVEVRTEKPTPVGAITAGVLVPLLLLAIAGVVVFFLLRRRIGKKESAPEAPEFPYREGWQLDSKTVEITVEGLARQAAQGYPTAVSLKDFAEFVQEMYRDSRLRFTDAFTELKSRAMVNEQQQNLTTDEACLQSNRPKNRFGNILPFDHSRVCLSSDDDPTSGIDYINANYIAGCHRQREFIACQGPLPATVDDFWRMIWEQEVSLIVMLTLNVERGRAKCEQYWPSEEKESCVYGDIAVTLYSQSIMEVYALRLLDISCDGKSHRVTHIQMLTWEDFSAPNLDHLNTLMLAYRSHLPHENSGVMETPTVIHCSAGVGRTGTFIALDHLTRQIDNGQQTIDINGLILSLRKHRRHLVQSERQYVFIHDFMLHYLSKRSPSEDSPLVVVTKPSQQSLLMANGGSRRPKSAFANSAYREDVL